MPRYPHTFSYSQEAVKGLVSKPENRIEAVRPLIEVAGGGLIDSYYTLVDSDGIVITEFTADVDTLTVSMAVGSTGAIADFIMTILIQIDDAVKVAEKAEMLTEAYRAWSIAAVFCYVTDLGVTRLKVYA